MSEESLFRRHQIYGVIQGQAEAVKKEVQSIPANTLLNASEHDLMQAIIEKFRLDVWYVDHRTFWLDMKIIVLTVARVFRREGISAAGEATMSRFTGTPAPNKAEYLKD